MTTIGTSQADVPEGVIDLGIGQPDPSVFPVDIIRRAALECFGLSGSIDHYQYGAEYGDGRHRVELARFLTGSYGFEVDPELLFTSNGNSQALDMVCTVFTRAGDVVVVEDPTYFLAAGIFAEHGLEVVGVSIGDDGLDPGRLDQVLSKLAEEGRPAKFVYTIPAFHNPTGVTIPENRREDLVEVARRNQTLLVADEVYHLLTYRSSHPVPSAMSRWVDSGVVLSLGTFSKILAPGLRLGWIHGAAELLKALGESGLVMSGGGLNPIPSSLTTAVMRSGDLAANIHVLRAEYQRRVVAMHAALTKHMPEDVSWAIPDGGYFFWLAMPERINDARLRTSARTAGVGFRQWPLSSSQGGPAHHIRLSFAFYREPDLLEGVTRLGRAITEA